MTARGAKIIFIPTNNGLPHNRVGPELIALTNKVDKARAAENNVYIVRADVAGVTPKLTACGTTKIVAPDGKVLASASHLESTLIIADIVVTLRPAAFASV
jgi:predicted amidohydrolase